MLYLRSEDEKENWGKREIDSLKKIQNLQKRLNKNGLSFYL